MIARREGKLLIYEAPQAIVPPLPYPIVPPGGLRQHRILRGDTFRASWVSVEADLSLLALVWVEYDDGELEPFSVGWQTDASRTMTSTDANGRAKKNGRVISAVVSVVNPAANGLPLFGHVYVSLYIRRALNVVDLLCKGYIAQAREVLLDILEHIDVHQPVWVLSADPISNGAGAGDISLVVTPANGSIIKLMHGGIRNGDIVARTVSFARRNGAGVVVTYVLAPLALAAAGLQSIPVADPSGAAGLSADASADFTIIDANGSTASGDYRFVAAAVAGVQDVGFLISIRLMRGGILAVVPTYLVVFSGGGSSVENAEIHV